MQKIATRVFVISSILFGVTGIAFSLTIPREEDPMTDLSHALFIFLAATGFVVLSSFALSVAGKFLSGSE